MGRAIIVALTIVVLGFTAAALAVYFRRQAAKEKAAEKGWALKGDLNKQQEQLLSRVVVAAAYLLRDLASGPTDLSRLDEVNFLTSDMRARVETWLRDYNQMTKEISK